MSESKPPPRRNVLALVGFAALATLILALQLVAIERQSLTMDEPYHLLAGYRALAFGSNDLNWEHPPLAKLVAALPLLALDVPPAWREPVRLDQALERSRELFSDPALAERVRRSSRGALLVVFALPWLAAAYLLGREIGGAPCGAALVAMLGLSAMALPYLALVQTDAAVALGFALTLLAALRFRRAAGLRGAVALGAAFGLALAAKFSALLLAPVVLFALALPAAPRPSPGRRALLAAAAAAAALALFLAPYAVANRHHDPASGEASVRIYAANRGTLVVGDRLRALEPRLLALERVRPTLAQIATGVAGIRVQNAVGIYPTYAFGRVTSRGRWCFFPALLAIRLSLVLLAASLLALAAFRRAPFTVGGGGRGERREGALLAFAAAVYLAAAMASSYNLGSRHLLPVLPLLLLPAAFWASRSSARLGAVAGLLALEALLLSPRWMAATNTWFLGERNPSRFALGAGDTEYKQNFLELGREAKRRGIEGLKVVFPGTVSAEVAASVPGGSAIAPGEPVNPGWYAVTVLAERTLPAILAAPAADLHEAERFRELAKEWSPLLDAIALGEDHGYVAASFHLYRVR
jgi:hypothetical protein